MKRQICALVLLLAIGNANGGIPSSNWNVDEIIAMVTDAVAAVEDLREHKDLVVAIARTSADSAAWRELQQKRRAVAQRIGYRAYLTDQADRRWILHLQKEIAKEPHHPARPDWEAMIETARQRLLRAPDELDSLE